MAQTIRVDQLKMGSRMAVDIFETLPDGHRVLLYAKGQAITTELQLKRLREAGVTSVPVSPESIRVAFAASSSQDGVVRVQRLRQAMDEARKGEVTAERDVQQFFLRAQGTERPNLEDLELPAQEMTRMGRDEPEMLEVLNLLREFSPLSFRHSQNVASVALRVSLARNPLAGDEELRRVILAGLLHDVGLMHCMSLELLNQEEVDETSELFRDHPDFGVEMLKGVAGAPGDVRRAVAEHHERINGNGFPQGLSGTDIHPLAELIGLCDTYDRLTHGLNYRRALSPVAALNLIQGWAGREFHEELVLDFTRALGPWPLGAPVELENGQRGLVASRGNPFAPLVVCRSESGLNVVDCQAEGLNVRRGVQPGLLDLHPTEIF